MSTFVIGHKHPDTDAICSAIGYADLLQRTMRPDAIAACCGEVNARTEFVLREAKLDHPRLLMDVRPTAGQISHREVISARDDEPLLDVFNRMQDNDLRSVPVLRADRQLAGLVSLAKLVDIVLPGGKDMEQARRVETSLARIRKVLSGRFLHEIEAEKEQPFIITVAALSAQKFVERIAAYPGEQLLIVTGDRPTVQRPAIMYGVRALVVTGNCDIDPELLALAREKKVSVLSSPHDTATTTLLLKCAKRISEALQTEVVSFPEPTLVKAMRTAVQGSNQALFPVTDEENRVVGVFSKSDLLSPPAIRLILVDHNEFAQAVNGIEEAEVVEVLDHHRLGGGLTSREPIRFINDPVGSTCTIVARMFREQGIEPGPKIALCLAAGMISDTLNLTSPTTTETDREMWSWLACFAPVDLSRFAEQFFATGSALQTGTPAEIVSADCKTYKESGWNIAVAQVEELGFDYFWPEQESLAAALRDLIAKNNLDFACLLITDISRHDSYLLVSGDAKIVEIIDYPRVQNDLFHLEGVVSRKKQLLPHLMWLLNKMPKE